MSSTTAGARFAICGDQEQVDKVIEVQETVHCIEHIIYQDPRGLRKYDHSRLHALADVQAEGRAAHERFERQLAEREAAVGYDDTCVMLYTSGTTGKSKGVVLSNRNVIETAKNSSEFDRLRPSDETLAYLPMAWVGDFIFSIGQAYWTGFCTNCPESPDTMMTDLREIGPTYFFAPPRVFETTLTTVMIRMEDAGAQARDVPLLHGPRPPRRPGAARRQAGRRDGPAEILDRRQAGLRAAEEHARLYPCAGGLHGG